MTRLSATCKSGCIPPPFFTIRFLHQFGVQYENNLSTANPSSLKENMYFCYKTNNLKKFFPNKKFFKIVYKTKSYEKDLHMLLIVKKYP